MKFVGWIEEVYAEGRWLQRVQQAAPTDWEGSILWGPSVPLPEGAGEGHFVSVHRTKAGRWYAVNLSERMPRITESQVKSAQAWAQRMVRLFDRDAAPTNDSSKVPNAR